MFSSTTTSRLTLSAVYRSANNKTIFKVLNDVFKGTNIGYKVLDRNIILYDKAVGADGVQMALQAATVKGSVVDATGEPVIGASILVQELPTVS